MMSEDKLKAVIEKIKKLFALSSSSNEHEASLSLQRAKEMMLRYNVEEKDLVEVEDIIEVDINVSNRFNIHNTTLAVHVGKAFNIKPLLIKTKTGYHKVDQKIRFIGATSDIAVGTYVYSYLLNIIDTKANDYFEMIRYSKDKWSPSGAKKVRSDYSYGFVSGVSKNLETIQKEREVSNPYEVQVEKALVVVKNAKIDDYIKNNVGKTKTVNRKLSYDRNAYASGQEAGVKQGIFNGVGHKPSSQLAIGG